MSVRQEAAPVAQAPDCAGRNGAQIEELRRAAHDAPLAKIYETHTGHKFIGVHSDAWWKASRSYMAALESQS